MQEVEKRQRVRAYYDFVQKTLTIKDELGVATPAPYGIMLTDVEFRSEFGRRPGCLDTGHLGFVDGVLVRTNMSKDDVKLMVGQTYFRVGWDGRNFYNSRTDENLTQAPRVIIDNLHIFVS